MRAGIDEAGRGPMLGPLVVAGVAIEDDDALREMGVRDSKKLTAARRERLAPEIRKAAAKTVTVVLSASDIDDGRNGATLNDLEMSAFVAVGRKLDSPHYILDAADTSSERFGREFTRRLDRSPTPQVLSMHRADAIHPVVAAASIIAKVERDRHVHLIAARLQRRLNLPVGSGYPSDRVTVTYLRTYLEQEGELPAEVRCSWKPIRGMLAQHNVRPLTRFE